MARQSHYLFLHGMDIRHVLGNNIMFSLGITTMFGLIALAMLVVQSAIIE